MKSLIFCLLLCSNFASANGWLENRAYQFQSTDARYLFILQAQQREFSKNNGYNSVVNFNGDIGIFGDQYNADSQSFHNSTAIGNMSSVTITGDGNNVSGNQDNDQGSNTAIAVGQDLSPWMGGVGTTIGGKP